jgi:ornithine decarboxylase
MTHARLRSAVSPLRRRAPLPEPARPLVDDVVAVERPSEPLHCLRPAAIEAAARGFVAGFPGDVLYAVKCNPEPRVLRAVWAGGVRHFDCASPAEVALVRQMFPKAAIHYMHPVKARAAIRDAWRQYGVRDFVLDSADELRKILEEAAAAGGPMDELGLVVRLALPKGGALYDLSGKFGAPFEETAELLRAARPHAARLGLSFHVGSQCMEPASYARALELAGAAIRSAGVAVEMIDVGGGFPARYPDSDPAPLQVFLDTILAGVEQLPVKENIKLMCEPGRALVAEAESLIVRVDARRGDNLFINDGSYGMRFDAAHLGFIFPVRIVSREIDPAEALAPFELWGPTCDSIDYMKGPFLLPASVKEGDYLEIGNMGAYGRAIAGHFNGYGEYDEVILLDEPMLSMYGAEARAVRSLQR